MLEKVTQFAEQAGPGGNFVSPSHCRGDAMKRKYILGSGKEGQIQIDGYVGVGWLLLSILLFTLVFLPVILL